MFTLQQQCLALLQRNYFSLKKSLLLFFLYMSTEGSAIDRKNSKNFTGHHRTSIIDNLYI